MFKELLVRCLGVAPGKLSTCKSVCVNLGILAILESPFSITPIYSFRVIVLGVTQRWGHLLHPQ